MLSQIFISSFLSWHLSGVSGSKEKPNTKLDFLIDSSTLYNQDTTPLWATVEVYEAGGFGLKIPFNYNESVKFFRQLYDANWIDRASRVIIIESNFYFESDHSFEAIK